MSEEKTESRTVSLSPILDMEHFLTVSGERRIDGGLMDLLQEQWEAWQSDIRARVLSVGENEYALVWLDAGVEETIDAAWKASPSQGLLLNNLADLLCMELVLALVPEVEDIGCAPAPEITPALRSALKAEGVEPAASGALPRRYAALTHSPFRGGCEVCSMRADCSKQKQVDSHSITLPGHEA